MVTNAECYGNECYGNECYSSKFLRSSATRVLTGDTRKIFVSNIKTVDESHSARVLIGCKPITRVPLSSRNVSLSHEARSSARRTSPLTMVKVKLPVQFNLIG